LKYILIKMSQQVFPVAVRDEVLNLDDKINYAVLRSGQNVSVQKYPAASATSQQLVFNVQVPSTSTIVSRNIALGSTFSITVAGTPAVGEYLVNFSQYNILGGVGGTVVYQGADCFAPFPINQMITNASLQINNTTVSLPVNQVLDPLLRCVDKKEFERWNSTCPTQLDKYGNYSQGLCQAYSAGTEVPAAGTPAQALQAVHVPSFNSPFNNFEDSNCNNNEVPRGSFRILSITGNTVGDGATVKTVIIRAQSTEPIFVSPFLFGEKVECPGLAGITQINATFQMAGASPTRVLRWVTSPTCGAKAITNVTFEQADTYLELVYYTPKPSDMIPQTVVTPLATYVNYILPTQNGLTTASGATGQLQSNSIQLNSYPDKVWVWVDDFLKFQQNSGAGANNNLAGCGVSDHYGSITGVSVVLNNASGLLSTYSSEQLFRASYLSGCQQSYSEYSGLQQKWGTAGTIGGVGVVGVPSEYISTCGSMLVLDFAKIIPILQDYFSPGSLSTAQFQIRVDYKNNTQATIQPQLNLLMMYSGILSTSNGSSSAYTSGILTKEQVLSAMAVPRPISTEKLARYVGSGLMSSLKSLARSALPEVAHQLAPGVEKLGQEVVSKLARKMRQA